MAVYDLLHRKSFISAGEVNSRIGDTFPKASQFALHASSSIPNLVQCAIILSTMFWLAWREALFSLVFILFISFFVWLANRRVSRIASQIPEEQRGLVCGIERVARNWLLVRILRTAAFESIRLNQNILNYSTRFIRSKLLANAAAALPIIMGGVMLVSIIGLNQSVLETPGPTLVAFLYLLVRFTQQLAAFAKSFGMASTCFPHFKLSAQYFYSIPTKDLAVALHPERLSVPDLTDTSTQTSAAAPRIEIQNLYFRYESEGPWVIENLSLEVPSGNQLGIVGRSGTGKSTLLAMILGVLEPNRGSIRIDGMSPKDYFQKSDVHVGYVGAEPFLIEGSIEQNLRYGSRKNHSESELWAALKMAQIDDIIEQKPGRLAFSLKENGEGLSAGQKQRLALARAFLVKPQLLVLDEASANLDEQTEREITQAISSQNLDWTVVIVSHREGILQNCKTIYRLDPASQAA
ncbi:MAG: ABC transporter ATP-binding protein [Bradymonadales bacterium]|nr:MAG: ABC transporter ATP-binding protein [Bradymonadales bacterium]